MFSFKVSLDLKMFLNYAKCDFIEFTWGIYPEGISSSGDWILFQGEFVRGDFVLEPV